MSDTEYDENGAAEEFVELDLDKTLTWTGNAVIVQRGTVFRMPLLVPYPSVLAIQFEVEGGYDIEFSLTFKDDHEQDSSVLVEPVRVSDREGQLDIDTTGVCEIIWSAARRPPPAAVSRRPPPSLPPQIPTRAAQRAGEERAPRARPPSALPAPSALVAVSQVQRALLDLEQDPLLPASGARAGGGRSPRGVVGGGRAGRVRGTGGEGTRRSG